MNYGEKKELVFSVNKNWRKYDVIIYTPAITMGVSFDDEYFDYGFAYIC